MKRKSFKSLLLTAVIIWSGLLSNACLGNQDSPDHIVLKSLLWTVSVNPSKLEIVAKAKLEKSFVISAAQAGFKDIQDFKRNENSLGWFVKNKKLHISMSLKGDELNIDFIAEKPGELTFPLIPETRQLKAYILPNWEGRYLPLDDQFWRDYLSHRTFDTLEGLTMPFWGLDLGTATMTYIVTNRFNNELKFTNDKNKLQAKLTHRFKDNQRIKKIGFIVKPGSQYSPVEPARHYREYLIRNNLHVTMAEKVKTIPKAERLKGAIHAYLWGSLTMSFDDVFQDKWKALCHDLVKQSKTDDHSPGKRFKELLPEKSWKEVVKMSNYPYQPFQYLKIIVAEGLSKALMKQDFYQAEYFDKITLPKALNHALNENRGKILPEAERFRLNSRLFHALHPDKIRNPDDWGYGYSKTMLRQLKAAGIKRARLIHDLWDFGMVDTNPGVAEEADQLGYLLGPYDSYHSIHDPKHYGTDNSWSTAQHGQYLYDTGGVRMENGRMKEGFNKKGYALSPIAARPWVEKRVNRIMQFTPYNSYFIDCDAYGEAFDDYSKYHPATQAEDISARVDRMRWIGETHQLVLGSEGGSSYAAPVIHVAEGILSQVFGRWMDPDFVNNKSRYFLGRWHPGHAPENFLKEVPLKEKFIRLRYDPRFRLPLNEIVFHDSFVSTNHYSSPIRKFTNAHQLIQLTSLLYLLPPMYHFNPDEFARIKHSVKKHHDFFYPLHSVMGFAQMTDFEWLTKDRMVQKTKFGDDLELVANFSDKDYTHQGITVSPKSILAGWIKSGKTDNYSPEDL